MTDKKNSKKDSAETEQFDGVAALGLDGVDEPTEQPTTPSEATAVTEVLGDPAATPAPAASAATEVLGDPLPLPEPEPLPQPGTGWAATPPEQPRYQPGSSASVPTAPYPQASPQVSAAPAKDERRPALFGTILWGVILLGFAVFMIVTVVATVVIDPTIWLIGGLTAVGAVLVVAGIAAAIRRG